MAAGDTIGFVGLGVMGLPMCRNMARKSGRRFLACDADPARDMPPGIGRAGLAEIARSSATIFLSLPSGLQLAEVCDALLAAVEPGAVVVDLGTSPVDLTRDLAGRFAAAGSHFADAPVARTRAAAEAGTLSVMVGADPALFARIEPLLATIASEITLCGQPGAGQVVKLMNNMVVTQTVVALSEALAVARRSGVEPAVLFDALAKGSADSFALRNHGMKAVLPGEFPERAFSTDAMRKDLSYALALAETLGLDLRGAETAAAMLLQASMRGDGERYWPVVSRVIDETR